MLVLRPDLSDTRVQQFVESPRGAVNTEHPPLPTLFPLGTIPQL